MIVKLKKFPFYLIITLLLFSCAGQENQTVTMDKDVLMDKIKGGWAAQTIGVTYGGPTEFRFRERYIPDSIEIPWPGTGYHKEIYETGPVCMMISIWT